MPPKAKASIKNNKENEPITIYDSDVDVLENSTKKKPKKTPAARGSVKRKALQLVVEINDSSDCSTSDSSTDAEDEPGPSKGKAKAKTTHQATHPIWQAAGIDASKLESFMRFVSLTETAKVEQSKNELKILALTKEIAAQDNEKEKYLASLRDDQDKFIAYLKDEQENLILKKTIAECEAMTQEAILQIKKIDKDERLRRLEQHEAAGNQDINPAGNQGVNAAENQDAKVTGNQDANITGNQGAATTAADFAQLSSILSSLTAFLSAQKPE